MPPILRTLFFALILAACGGQRALYVSGENKSIGKEIGNNSGADSFLQYWTDSVKHSMNKVIGYADTAFLNTDRKGNLGNMVADMGLFFASQYMLDSFGFTPHFSLFNAGGLRNSLPHDSIRRRDVFEALPFDNKIVFLELSGNAMDSLLHKIASKGGEPVSNLRIWVKNGRWHKALLGENSFDSRRSYWIVTSDYLANGGDDYAMLTHPLQRYDINKTWRSAVEDGISYETQNYGSIQPRKIQRIIAEP